MAERFFATRKAELIDTWTGPTRAVARQAVFAWLAVWYNRPRRHSAIAYRRPVAHEEQRLSSRLALLCPGQRANPNRQPRGREDTVVLAVLALLARMDQPVGTHPRPERRPRRRARLGGTINLINTTVGANSAAAGGSLIWHYPWTPLRGCDARPRTNLSIYGGQE